MITRRQIWTLGAMLTLLFAGLLTVAQEKKQDGERDVKQADLPPAALAGLRKVAGEATLTKFSEEVADGHTFYEGSWKGQDGNVDALVTETGDVVEIEETTLPAKVPAAVRRAAEQAAGEGAAFERKTLYLYEIHFKKEGKKQEMIFTADGRPYQSHD